MKLIFLNRYFHPDISATSQMLSSLAFDLAAQGASVEVIASRQTYEDPAARLISEESISGVQVHRVRTTRLGRRTLAGRALDYASFYLSASMKLAAIASPGDILIAKTDPPLLGVPAAAIARLRRARLINWLQDVFPEVAERAGIRLGPLGPILAACRNYSLRAASANVVVGSLAKGFVAGIPRVHHSEVIHNWADGTTIHPLTNDKNPLRKQWSLEDRFVVAYSGNMGRAHEFETLLAAAESMRSNARVAFLFIGGGHHRIHLESEARARGLENVSFRPYQPAEYLCASLAAADVHVVTMKPEMEGLVVPSKIYGILAAGRPVLNIGDLDGEVAQIVALARAGFTVAPGDPGQLARKILDLSSDPALCADLGRNGRIAFDRTYSRQLATARWKDLLLAVDPAAMGRRSASR